MKYLIAMIMAVGLYGQQCEQVMYVDAYTGQIQVQLVCSD